MVTEIWVGQFSIVGGETRERGPWAGMHPARSNPLGADLYILVEPAFPGSEELCPSLVEVIGRLFRLQRSSLTGALLASLKAAHERLRDWNQKSLREHQVGAGASCLALRGAQAYLAQAGPAVAYHRTQEGTKRVSPEDETAEPIGTAAEFYPRLTRHELVAGDALLLATSSLPSVAAEEVVEAVLALPPQDILGELFLRVRQVPDFAALLIAFLPGPPR